MFDKKAFETNYRKGIAVLKRAEGTVREQVNALSRSVLEALHATEQIGYVNGMLAVLTPANRNVAIEFFRHFGGFHYDETSAMFTKKSAKRYSDAEKMAQEFLLDPHNNMFSWAQRQKLGRAEPEFKPVDFLKNVHKNFLKQLQTAKDHGISQKELFEQMLKREDGKPGVDVEALVAVLAAMGEVEVKEEA